MNNRRLEKVLGLSKAAAKALYIIENTGRDTSTSQVQGFLSCSRNKALDAINELRTAGLVRIYKDVNGIYGDYTKGYKVTSI